MPVVSGATLVARVRDYADQPDDGQESVAYITDAMILDRLSKEYRKLLRKLSRGQVFIGRTQDSLSPAASVTLSTSPMAILAVYQDYGDSRTRLKRLVDSVVPKFVNSSTLTEYWEPSITAAGAFTLKLYPTPTGGTLQVFYVPEPSTLTTASSIYLSDSWEDAVVLGAACRCYVKEDGVNTYLKLMYEQALEEVDLDAAQFTAGDGAVIRNSDEVYTPGMDQYQIQLDPADFWYSP